MKTLLIYGDSFGEETMHNHIMREKTMKFRTFHSDIRESGIFDQVIVYAQAATDLWDQYKIFNKTFTGNEYVLWFETDPLRFSGPDGSKYTNIATNISFMNSTTDEYIHTRCRAAIHYWMYLQDEFYVNFVHKTIIDDINARCKKLLILPCFNTSHSFVDSCLAELPGRELRYWNFSYEELERNKLCDLRRNHMSETNHAILGSMLVDYYKTGKLLDFNKFQDPVNEKAEKYFQSLI